jgi:hypothetical protein
VPAVVAPPAVVVPPAVVDVELPVFALFRTNCPLVLLELRLVDVLPVVPVAPMASPRARHPVSVIEFGSLLVL